MESLKEINRILGIKDSYQAPAKMMEIITSDERGRYGGMIPNYRLYDRENEEMEYFEDYREVSDMFSALDEDDGVYEEPMQSTGPLDINNKEIYEGDIVRILSHDSEFLTGEPFVQYDIKGVITIRLGGFWINDTPLCFLLNECNPSLTEINILGNIHQNPNLLEADSHD